MKNCVLLLALAAVFLSPAAAAAQVAPGVNPLLVPDSWYKGAATDGTDLGANFDVEAMIRTATGATTQTNVTDAIQKNKPFSLVADYAALGPDDDAPDGFRIYSNGAVLKTLTAAQAGCSTFPCTPRFDFTGFAKGTYVLFMEAFNTAGASGPSNTVTLTVTPNPPKGATNLRIIKGL